MGTDYNQRAQMEQVIAEGGSVYHRGAIIAKAEHLPSHADLAKGDPAAEGVARAELQRRRDAIDADLKQLDEVPAGEANTATATEPAGAKSPKATASKAKRK